MPAADYPLINGTRHEWSSVEIKVAGQIYLGVKEIKYSDKLEPNKLRGTHAEAIGRTRGEYNAEDGSVVMYLQEANALRQALGPGYKEVPFDIVVSYSDEGVDTIQDEIIGCRIKGDEGGGSQGADALVVTFALDVMKVRWNGIESLKKPLA